MRVFLAGTLTAAVVVLTACGGTSNGGSEPAASDAVAVELAVGKEFAVAADPGKTASGNVTFKVTNHGKAEHELVIVPLAAGASPQALMTQDGEASEDGSPGEVEGLEPGATKEVTVDLKPGTYALLCNEPGHFAGGMATTFTVQ